MAVFYDGLLIIRRVIRHGQFWISLEDFFFWLICAWGVFLFLVEENNGILRWFAVGGAILGAFLYKKTVSKCYINIMSTIGKSIKGCYQLIKRCETGSWIGSLFRIYLVSLQWGLNSSLFSNIGVSMRLDKFLKVSRLIKRRTVANEACDAGRVLVNDKPAKASTNVKEGDTITIAFGNKDVKVEVLSVQEVVRKDEARELFRYL